jgi:hypothetical protein
VALAPNSNSPMRAEEPSLDTTSNCPKLMLRLCRRTGCCRHRGGEPGAAPALLAERREDGKARGASLDRWIGQKPVTPSDSAQFDFS